MDGTGGGSPRGKPKDSDESSDEDDADSKETIQSNITLNISKAENSLPTSARTTPGTSRRGSDVYSAGSKPSCGYQTPGSKCSSVSMPSRVSSTLSRHSAPARSDQISPERTGRRNSLPESIFNTSVGILGAIAKIPKRLAFPDDVESESSELLEPMTAPSSWASTTSKGQCHCLKKYENAFPKYKLVCRCNLKKLNQLSKPSEEKLMRVTEAESTYSVRKIKCPHSGESRKALAQQATFKECPPEKNKQGVKGSCCDFGAVMKKRIKDDEDSKGKEKDASHSPQEKKAICMSDPGKQAPTLIPKLSPEKKKPTLEAADKDRGKPIDRAHQPGPSRQGSDTKLTPKKSLPESKQPQPSTKIPVAKKDSRDNIKLTKSPSDGKIAKKPIEVVKDPPVHSSVVRVSSKSSWQQISKLEVITEEQAEVDKGADKPAAPEVVVHMPPKKQEQEKPKPTSPATRSSPRSMKLEPDTTSTKSVPSPSTRSSPRSIKPAPDTISSKSVPSTSSFGKGSKTPSRKGSEIYDKDTLSRKPSTASTSIKAAQEPTPQKPTTAIPVRRVASKERQKEEKKPKLPDQPSKQSTKIPDEAPSVREKESVPSRKTSTSSIPPVAKKPVDKIPPDTDGKPTPGPSAEMKPTSPKQKPAEDLMQTERDDKTYPKPSKKDIEPKKIQDDTLKKPADEVHKPVVTTPLPLPSTKEDVPKDVKPLDEKHRETPKEKEPEKKLEVKHEKQKPVEIDVIESKDRPDTKDKALTIREDKNKEKEYVVEEVPLKHDVVQETHPKEDIQTKEEPSHKKEVYKEPKVVPPVDKKEPKEPQQWKEEHRPVESDSDEKRPKEELKEKQKIESPIDKKELSTQREGDQRPPESPLEVKSPILGKEKSPSKEEVGEKPKTEIPVEDKLPKEQSKEKPAEREGEHTPTQSPSQVKRPIWGKAKSPSKEDVVEKPKTEIPLEEKLPKEQSKEKPTEREGERRPTESPSQVKRPIWGKAKSPSKEEVVEKPVEEKRPKEQSKEKPTEREGERRPTESPSQVKRPIWGKAKSPSREEVVEKPVEEKRPKEKSKEKPTEREGEHRPTESPSQVKRPIWGKEKSASKEEVVEKPKTEIPLEEKRPKEQSKEKPTEREGERRPTESPSQVKRPIWGKAKSPSREEVVEKPVEEKRPKEKSKEKPTEREGERRPTESPSQVKRPIWGKAKSPSREEVVEKPVEEKRPKEKSKEKPTEREGERRPTESPSQVKRPIWGKAKSPSREEVVEKPKEVIPVEEKRPKEKPTEREDKHTPTESPSQVKRPIWGKAKSPSKEVIEKPKVEEEKRPKEQSKEKPTEREGDRRPTESPSQVKRPIWGKARTPSKQEVVEKPKVESPVEEKRPKEKRWSKEKIPKKRDGDEERSADPVSDKRQPNESHWMKRKGPTTQEEPRVEEKKPLEKKKSKAMTSVSNFRHQSIMGIKNMMSGTKRNKPHQQPSSSAGAATSKRYPAPIDEIVTIYSNVHAERSLSPKEKNYSDWKHAIFAQDSNLIEEIKAMIRGEKEENKVFNESRTVRKSFVTPLLSRTNIGESRSSGIVGDKSHESTSPKSKSSRSKERFIKGASGRGSEGKSITAFWRNISRITPVRKHSTEKSRNKKDKRDKKNKHSEDNEDTEDSQFKQKDSSKCSKDRFTKRACGKRDSEDNPMSTFWKSISRITPITQDDHRRDRSRPTSSRRLIDDSNIFVAERIPPSTPMYMKSKRSHHSMLRAKTGYWIDEKGLYREIVEMAHDQNPEDPPVTIKSSRWYKKSDQDLPGTSKDIERR